MFQAAALPGNRLVKRQALPNDRRIGKCPLPRSEAIAEMLFPLIALHLGRSRRAQKRQLDAVFLHTDAILAIVQHRASMCIIAQRSIMMIADLKTLLVITAASMRRTLDKAKLHLVNRVFRADIHRELHLEQTVQFMPIDGRIKRHDRTGGSQRDALADSGMSDPPRPYDACRKACRTIRFEYPLLLRSRSGCSR